LAPHGCDVALWSTARRRHGPEVLALVGGGALGVVVGLSLGLLVLVAGGGVLPPELPLPPVWPLPPAPPVVGTGVLLGVDDEPEPDESGDGAAVGGFDWMAAVRSARTLAIAARIAAARLLVIAPLAVSACTAVFSASRRDMAWLAFPAAAL
jgi:hypothetical protein